MGWFKKLMCALFKVGCPPSPDPCEGVRCPQGEICQGGECVPSIPPDPCEGIECRPLETCVDGECVEDPPDPHFPKCNQPPDRPKCDCWNKPPGPSEWEYLECAEPPTLDPCQPPEDTFEPGAGGRAQHHAEVLQATSQLGSLPGLTPRQKLVRLAERIVKNTGWCCFAGGDAIFILREDWGWGEYHAVSFGDGGWTNSGRGKWIGWHKDNRVTNVGLAYPDPREVKLTFQIHKQGGKVDTTLTTVGTLDYCRAVRMGKHGALPRAGCPVRPEGHPERGAWERVILGRQKHWCNGERMGLWNGNYAVAQGSCWGHYKTCSEDGKICAEKDGR